MVFHFLSSKLFVTNKNIKHLDVNFVLKGTQLEKELEEKPELLADGFTFLAPSDEAFNKLDEELFTKILTDKKFADEVLRLHILKGW